MKVLVACNHTLIGQSIVGMLPNLAQSGATTEARLCSFPQAVDENHTWRANAVLVEAITDFPLALETIRALLKSDPETRCVVLGSGADETAIFEAINAGAVGFLSHDASPDTVGATLRGVANGELGLSRAASLRMIQLLRQSQQTQMEVMGNLGTSKFTQREREVFELVRRGLRSREIASRLSIAEATVYKHIQNILDKLQVRSRTEAVYVFERLTPEQSPVTPPLQ